MDHEKLQKKIVKLIKPIIKSMGLRLWGIEIPSTPKKGILRIYVDSENGVTIDQCAELSRHLNLILDVEDPIPGPYNLEVSSPGLERKFFELEQLKPYINYKINLKLKQPVNGRKNWKGTVLKVEDQKFVLLVDNQQILFSWDQIQKANLIFNG